MSKSASKKPAVQSGGDAQSHEVERNYKVFQKRLPALMLTHRGKFALMHAGEVAAFYDTLSDAYTTGEKFLGGKPFSIQEITDEVVDLGWFSRVPYALH